MSRMDRLGGVTRKWAEIGKTQKRVFFCFNREKILATTHLAFQPLNVPFAKINIFGLRQKDAVALNAIFGQKLIDQILEADQFKITVLAKKKIIRYFDFYAGENKDGVKIVLVHLF